jgi:sulfatase maturation enzyme AslB (radical SAM superfamily)
MIEWSKKNTYNPMNSMKGLTYYEHYKKILGWMDGKNELPAPIEASLDPISTCNNKCYYCSSNQYNDKIIKRWGLDYIEDLMVDLSTWGVKAFCWGGRESTLNLRLAEATRLGVTCGMEAAIVTNGVYLPDDLLDTLLLCKWIGVSVDTCNPKVYQKVRGTDDCLTVWRHIAILARKKTTTTLGVRALVLPETIDTLYQTCYAAREVGASFCHIRPADLERKDLAIAQKLNLDMPKIKDIFDKCHELETPDFGVYTVTHKYDENFHVKHDFKGCLASPLVVQICTDKKRYLCVDHRMDSHYEVKEWGSDQHRDLIKSIDPAKECSRCTWGTYNQQMEQAVLEDRMHLCFP